LTIFSGRELLHQLRGDSIPVAIVSGEVSGEVSEEGNEEGTAVAVSEVQHAEVVDLPHHVAATILLERMTDAIVIETTMTAAVLAAR
jgi:hypothetical protein